MYLNLKLYTLDVLVAKSNIILECGYQVANKLGACTSSYSYSIAIQMHACITVMFRYI